MAPEHSANHLSANSTTLIPTNPNPGALAPVDKDNSAAVKETEQREIELERQQDAPDLIDFLKKTISSIRSHRQADWLTILNSQARCVAYYDDRQYGEARDGKFVDYQRRPGDIRPIDNQYKIQVDKLLMEIARALPDIQVTASDPNDTMMVEGAKFAQYRLKTNRKRLLKKKFRLREAMALLTKAMTYRYTVFNAQAKNGPKVKNPRKAKKTYGQTRSLQTCGMCGGPMKMQPTDGQPTDSYKCANCGSNRMKMVEVSAQEREIVEGYDEAKAGCVQSHHIDPCMVRISLSAREGVADSPFLWYTQMIARCILEAAYPDYRITSTGEVTDAARYKRDAESVPSNADQGLYPYQNHGDADAIQQTAGGDQFEELQFDLFWLDPSVYAGRTWKTDQRLRGGRVLKAGESADSMFPDGMCVAATAINDILDCYPEDKNAKWTFCVYGVREWALVGSGTNALLGPQDTRNDLKAYLIANNYYNAGRREFIRSGAFTGNRLPTMDEAAVVENVPDDKPVEGWAHSQAPGNSLPAQSMELYQSETGALSEGAGTASLDTKGTSFYNATKTATGIAAMRDMSVGRMGPNLMLLTDMEEEHSYQVLEQEQDGYKDHPEIFMKMANQSVTAEDTDGSITFSADGVEAFMQMDIRSDLDITAVEGSWMPRTEGEKQAKLQAFGSFAAEVTEKMGADPRAQELIAMAADVFGVPLKIDGWSATEHVAAARIRALAETCGVMEKRRSTSAPTEENVQQVIINTPEAYVDKEMDNHALFVSFYKEWWSSDEGQSCSPLLRAVIKAEEILHRKGMVYQAQEMIKDKIESEAPQMVAAKATAAESATDPKQKISESINYKDAPPDIRRQMEAAAGMQPSAGEPAEDDGTQSEVVKAHAKMAVQEQAAQLDSQKAKEEADLEMQKNAQKAALEEERSQADHSRAQEAAVADRDHEEGIKGADLMHKTIESQAQREAEDRRIASEHAHQEKTQSDQRKTEVQEHAADRQHKEKIARLKPPTMRKSK